MSMRAMKKHNPWITPEGYFESFPERMMERIHQEENKSQRAAKTPKVMPLWKRWAVAATAVGVAGLVSVGLFHTQDAMLADSEPESFYDDEMVEYAMLNNVDIEYYLTQY